MKIASILTTLFAVAAGFWAHRTYLKGRPLVLIVAGTVLFGEIFKWVTGIETIPLKISETILRKTSEDQE